MNVILLYVDSILLVTKNTVTPIYFSNNKSKQRISVGTRYIFFAIYRLVRFKSLKNYGIDFQRLKCRENQKKSIPLMKEQWDLDFFLSLCFKILFKYKEIQMSTFSCDLMWKLQQIIFTYLQQTIYMYLPI